MTLILNIYVKRVLYATQNEILTVLSEINSL